ncbi:MAG: insulinase family protein [Candidatus Bostrichicola ureolyticus]|nr:MAG: insulinase family protein [Candidatus Bostrichicola ureolyticus]
MSSKIDINKVPTSDPLPKISIKNIKSFKLDNGLKVFLIENKFPLIQIGLTFDIEPIKENKIGIKHIMKDMFIAGTENYTKEELYETLEYLGSNIDISESCIYMSVLSKHIELSIKILSDIIIKPKLNSVQELNNSINKLIIYLNSKNKDINYIITNVIGNKLFYGNNHPYGKIVSEKSLKKITINDIKLFYNTYYKPNVASITFMGSISIEQVEFLVKKYFSLWKKGIKLNKNYTFPKHYELEIDLININSAKKAFIYLGNPLSLDTRNKDYLAAKMVNNILGVGPNSRLFMNIREYKNYAYYISSNIIIHDTKTSFRIVSQINLNTINDTINLIIKELNNITTYYVSDKELENNKKEEIGNFIMNLEDPITYSNFVINKNKFTKNFFKNYIINIESLTKEEILETAKKYFSINNFRIIIISNNYKNNFNIKEYPIYLYNPNGDLIKKLN